MPKRTAAVEEAPVAVLAGGRSEALLRATPESLRELAAGHLLALGRIRSSADLRAVDVEADRAGVGIEAWLLRVQLADDAPGRNDAHPPEAVHALGCESCRATLAAGRREPPGSDVFARLLEQLYAHAERYADTGGVHAAGLSDGERLLFPMEDVGRHNAVDKTIGAALLAEVPLASLGLVVSSRISGEIAWKAARAGLAWVASRSLPTTLAVAVAEAAGLPLVARAGKTPTLFP